MVPYWIAELGPAPGRPGSWRPSGNVGLNGVRFPNEAACLAAIARHGSYSSEDEVWCYRATMIGDPMPVTRPLVPTTDPTPAPADGIFKVKVKVTRNRRGEYNVESSHMVGHTVSIIGHIPDNKLRSQATRFSGHAIEMVMSYCPDISCVMWQDAIAAEILARLTLQESHEATEATVVSSAYLAMGNALYKLQPIAHTRTSAAMKALRARVTNQSKAEAARIVADANTNAAAIVAQATARLAEANHVLHTNRNAPLPPPAWAAGYPLMYRTHDGVGKWCVGLNFNFYITKFEARLIEANPAYPANLRAPRNLIHKKSWNAQRTGTVTIPKVPVLMWLPLASNGNYHINALFMDISSPELPHVSHGSACMSLSTTITAATSVRQLEELRDRIAFVLQTVEIYSLYVPASAWDERICKFCPPALLEHLKHGWDRRRAEIMALPADAESRTDTNAADSETWAA